MIFYFSATGNSRHVAQRLAKATGDKLLYIPDLMSSGHTAFTVGEGECVGLVVPTYFWGLPALVEDFLEKLVLYTPPSVYIYLVATYGSTPGAIGAFTERLLEKKGLRLSSRCSVQMPDTWTPIFDLSDKEKLTRKNAAAEVQIDQAVAHIQKRECGDFIRRKAPLWLSRAVARPLFEKQRSTAPFKVSDTCIGCALCAEHCPVGVIAMQDGRPVWEKNRCEICLGCLHRCPKFAIQYGDKTAKHGQYQHPEC